MAFIHLENKFSSSNPKDYYFHYFTKKNRSFSWISCGELRLAGKNGLILLYRKCRIPPMSFVAEENDVSTTEEASCEGVIIYRSSASQTHF
jgi:hypothetical protein